MPLELYFILTVLIIIVLPAICRIILGLILVALSMPNVIRNSLSNTWVNLSKILEFVYEQLLLQ